MEYAGKGVNVALISIGGRVDEAMNTLNPKTIAEWVRLFIPVEENFMQHIYCMLSTRMRMVMW